MCLRVRRVLANRRGVTGAIFAIATAILVGAVAIATEGGLFYLGRQQSYSVADAAAIAGALAYASGGDSNASKSAAKALAQQNGFNSAQSGNHGAIAGAASSTVTVNVPPRSGNYTDSTRYPSATEVVIGVDYPTYLLSLFHAADITVGSRAVAAIQQTGNACMLSLTGDLTVGMGTNSDIFGTCSLASNAMDSGAVTFTQAASSSATIITHGITSRGGCTNCPTVDPLWGLYDTANPNDQNQMDRPVAAYQPPTENPFATIPSSLSFPSDPSQITCPTTSTVNMTFPDGTPSLDPTTHCPTSPTRVTITGTVPPTQPDPLLAPPSTASVSSACGTGFNGTCAFYNMYITLDSAVSLEPGTYLLLNASFSVNPGASVACAGILNVYQCGSPSFQTNSGITGVNFVLAGVAGITPTPQMGQIKIDPASSVALFAASPAAYPAGSATDPLGGVLFYRDALSLPADSAPNPSVIIADDGTGPNAPSLLEGVMYFPQANVWYAGNVLPPNWAPSTSTSPLFDCAVVVAGTLNIGYQSGGSPSNVAYFSNSCQSYGFTTLNSLPTVQAATLVE